MPKTLSRLNERLEAVCATGCDAVRASIELLEQGKNLDITDGLSSSEQELLLNELKAIMAVYDRH